MKCTIIGITGGTGSGKSTFTNRLKNEFPDEEAFQKFLADSTTGVSDKDAGIEVFRIAHLGFQYLEQIPVLKDVNLVLDDRSTAIIGQIGAGKTTLVKLLTGIYKTQKGEILYGVQNINNFESVGFYRNVSIVSQDFVKYEMTLRENIAISDWKHLDDTDKLQELLIQMDLPEFSSKDALDMLLGSEFDGRDLSIGQWQKLAIARCMCKNSSMIVLDEPTAALDPIMETTILKMFLKITKEKTAIIV